MRGGGALSDGGKGDRPTTRFGCDSAFPRKTVDARAGGGSPKGLLMASCPDDRYEHELASSNSIRHAGKPSHPIELMKGVMWLSSRSTVDASVQISFVWRGARAERRPACQRDEPALTT